MYIVAWFAYLPAELTLTTHTFTVNLIDKCRKTVIVPSPLISQPFYYQVGEPALTIPIPDWTHTYTEADCGPFTYSFSANSRPISLVMTGAVKSQVITIQTNDD
jgi:hypothetical protein